MIRIVKSSYNNPYYNLALEESLFHYCEEFEEVIFYLWQNDNTVVIGRNQTVFTECDLEYAKQYGVKIARRMTGGGAVYHDLGNLNFTIIVPKNIYDYSRSTQVVINALKSLGVIAKINGRNDIFYNDFKISGNAYYSTDKAGLHHGTLLIDVDLNRMYNLLNTSRSKMSKAGIVSVQSRVKNLKEICSITVEELEKAMISSFIEQYGLDEEILYGYDIERDSSFSTLYAKYSSNKWIFEQVREYFIRVEGKYTWGNATLSCEIDSDKILKFSISSDSLYTDIINRVEAEMNCSQYFLENNIIDPIHPESRKMITDLYGLRAQLLSLIQEDESETL